MCSICISNLFRSVILDRQALKLVWKAIVIKLVATDQKNIERKYGKTRGKPAKIKSEMEVFCHVFKTVS